MIIPVRCFTCNKVIGNKWDPYCALLRDGIDSGEALNKLGLIRYCCRRMLITHVDLLIDKLNYDKTFNSKASQENNYITEKTKNVEHRVYKAR